MHVALYKIEFAAFINGFVLSDLSPQRLVAEFQKVVISI